LHTDHAAFLGLAYYFKYSLGGDSLGFSAKSDGSCGVFVVCFSSLLSVFNHEKMMDFVRFSFWWCRESNAGLVRATGTCLVTEPHHILFCVEIIKWALFFLLLV
jgi:hypothetical protein